MTPLCFQPPCLHSNRLNLRRHDLPKRIPHRISMASPAANRSGQQNVLVLGGTGRVGTETVKALIQFSQTPIAITLAGRNPSRGESLCRQLSKTPSQYPVQLRFAQLDLNDHHSLRALLPNHHLVIHTAGPFQRRPNPTAVLQAAMHTGVPYMDICDDLDHSMQCKQLDQHARQKGYTALISTGIYPGLSNLMAAQAVESLSSDHVDSLKIYYHTAGSGGIGATVLASTFLILGEKAVCFDTAGKKIYLPAAGSPELTDFGGKIGPKTTYLLNLPEVVSLRDVLFAKDAKTQVFAKFSTAPPVWNWLLQVMAKAVPADWLGNRDAMLRLATFSMPIVKAVDKLSGARTGIKVVAQVGAEFCSALYEHETLDRCVGEATASFAVEMLDEKARTAMGAGILFPEELAVEVRRRIIRHATVDADIWFSNGNVGSAGAVHGEIMT